MEKVVPSRLSARTLRDENLLRQALFLFYVNNGPGPTTPKGGLLLDSFLLPFFLLGFTYCEGLSMFSPCLSLSLFFQDSLPIFR